MKKGHILFKKEHIDFLFNIDNKRTANSVGEITGSSKEFRYKFIKVLSNLDLVTTKPLQLTKKGESLKKKLQKISDLFNDVNK